ncbi:ABC transporter substrate-binding protein [Saccharomonospora sp. NB11]|uniref:ABC transporter substrate-binding protein n=1 Tax=Saccharomonospora sp. NB11 TaxID=1642298 RepID=UPI0018D18D18|nr:extracellular solute-binding protein [Saccharomonospora sp. NB11]
MPLTFLTDLTSPGMRAFAERIVRDWNESRPGISAKLSTLDHEEFRDRLEDYLTNRCPPDVLTWFAGNRMRSLGERGLMLDISRTWRESGLAEQYLPRFREMVARSGPAHFLPTAHYWWGVYYRPSVFESAGISTPVRTWEELEAAARRLRGAGITPFSLGSRYRCPATAWFDYLNMRLNGPDFHRDLMDLRVPYTDERLQRVFTFWRRLLDDGFFFGEPTEYDEEEAVAAVLRGEAGMTLIGSYITDEYAPDGETDLDFFRFPVIDPALPVGEDSPVDGYFVAGGSAHPEEAAAFLANLGSQRVQQWMVEAMTILPVRGDVDLGRAGTHVAKGAALLRDADHIGQFYDLDTTWELSNIGMDAFMSFLRDPGRARDLLAEVEDMRLHQLQLTRSA